MSLAWSDLSAAQQSVVNSIIAVANKLHVNPRTAVADAYVESKFNATAVGDNGSSFGIFQLHRGGELGSLTQQQAFDPTVNATTALTVFASNQGTYSDPGLLAAKSQRPADPSGYALKVDQLYNDPTFLSGLGAGTMSDLAPPNIDNTNGSGGSTINPVSYGSDAVSSVISGLTGGQSLADALTRGGLMVLGFAIIIVALHALTDASETPVGTVSSGASAAKSNIGKRIPTKSKPAKVTA